MNFIRIYLYRINFKGGSSVKTKFKNIMKILVTIVIISMVAVGCGKANKETASIESKAVMDVSMGKDGLNNNVATSGAATSQHSPLNASNTLFQGQGKIIRNGIIQMETLNFDETVQSILSKTNSVGAYVQSSNVSGRRIEANPNEERRSGQFILRIPKEKFDSFILDVGNLGSITNQQISSEDVTSAYFDTQAHLK